MRSGSTSSAPDRTIMGGWRSAAPSYRVARPVRVHVKLAAFEGQGQHAGVRLKERAVYALEQGSQLTLVRRLHDQHARTFARRKPPIVQIVPVHRHERAAKLVRKLVV